MPKLNEGGQEAFSPRPLEELLETERTIELQIKAWKGANPTLSDFSSISYQAWNAEETKRDLTSAMYFKNELEQRYDQQRRALELEGLLLPSNKELARPLIEEFIQEQQKTIDQGKKADIEVAHQVVDLLKSRPGYSQKEREKFEEDIRTWNKQIERVAGILKLSRELLKITDDLQILDSLIQRLHMVEKHHQEVSHEIKEVKGRFINFNSLVQQHEDLKEVIKIKKQQLVETQERLKKGLAHSPEYMQLRNQIASILGITPPPFDRIEDEYRYLQDQVNAPVSPASIKDRLKKTFSGSKDQQKTPEVFNALSKLEELIKHPHNEETRQIEKELAQANKSLANTLALIQDSQRFFSERLPSLRLMDLKFSIEVERAINWNPNPIIDPRNPPTS